MCLAWSNFFHRKKRCCFWYPLISFKNDPLFFCIVFPYMPFSTHLSPASFSLICWELEISHPCHHCRWWWYFMVLSSLGVISGRISLVGIEARALNFEISKWKGEWCFVSLCIGKNYTWDFFFNVSWVVLHGFKFLELITQPELIE